MENFIKNFAEQFDNLDVTDFTPNTNFKDLDDWNSLAALSIIAMIDDEYDVTLKGNDITTAITIEDLYNIVCSKRN